MGKRLVKVADTLMVSLVTVSLMTLVILHDITFFPENGQASSQESKGAWMIIDLSRSMIVGNLA
ncbi:hypothetical protein DAI22_11g040201 [Oryza sativa Japonica Group]|nr:hypothetical protein DAI22_11g040201 [Oryza sativa Japonica Group]